MSYVAYLPPPLKSLAKRTVLTPPIWQTFEESMLAVIASFKFPLAADGTTIKTPRLHLFGRESNTQVLRDLPGTDDLKTTFFLPNAAEFLPGSSPLAIG